MPIFVRTAGGEQLRVLLEDGADEEIEFNNLTRAAGGLYQFDWVEVQRGSSSDGGRSVVRLSSVVRITRRADKPDRAPTGVQR